MTLPNVMTTDQAQDEEASAEATQMRAARIDLNHFAPIYERYAGRVYAYCLRRIGDSQEAEDLTSTIFARAMTGLKGYQGGSVAAWLFRIARHTVVNHHVRVKRISPVPLDVIAEWARADRQVCSAASTFVIG